MKNKRVLILMSVVLSVAILGLIAFYLYDVFYNKTPVTQNLFRLISISFLLLATIIRLHNGSRRQSLDFYEKSYENELGSAFQEQPFVRKKLVCAVRLYNESNHKKALKYLSDVYKEVKHDRDAVAVLLFMALCYTDVGLNNEAIRIYYKLLEIDGRNDQVHSNIGLLYAHEGNYDMAIMHYDKAIEYNPNNYYAYSNRAKCYFDKGQYSDAETDAKKALKKKNNGKEAASLLTIIYALNDDVQNKEKYFHISVASGENPDDLKNAIDYFLKQKK